MTPSFTDLAAAKQTPLLLADAREALALVPAIPPAMRAKVGRALDLAARTAAGDTAQLSDLIRTVNDPEDEDDFPTWAGLAGHDSDVAAALDIAAYACGFIARVTAERIGHDPLPDPVSEALPAYRSYFEDQLRKLRRKAR